MGPNKRLLGFSWRQERAPLAACQPVHGWASHPWHPVVWSLLVVAGSWLFWTGATASAATDNDVTPELRQQAIDVLRQVLQQEPEWIKVHAAEFLLALDYPQGVRDAFLRELDIHGREPKYRIGIWRVLARATGDDTESRRWKTKIRDVLADPASPDRLHAMESLAKLGYQLSSDGAPFVEDAAREPSGAMATFAAWILVTSGRPGAEARLAELLESSDARTRGVAAYVLRHVRTVSPAVRQRLVKVAQREPIGSEARLHLVCAAAIYASKEQKGEFTTALWEYVKHGATSDRYLACQTLGRLATVADLPLLRGLLTDPAADVRSSAADAILRIGRRVPYHMTWLDWGVIAGYFVSMLAIGWYYSRRATTTDDYLLAGRSVRSLSAGLSLFASLFSTLSYLAFPGEMIKYGPLMAAGIIASLPLVGVIVGWFLIPFIMKLKVTSAYELLETHLGLGVRMLASFMFLLLRVFWMAALIYATVGVVLVPLMNLDQSSVPYLCIFLGLITVIYTAMGGLRAVMLTNVLKAVVLFSMAVLALVVITIRLGGVGAWWPTQWPGHWPSPVWGYDPSVRVSFLGAFVAMLVWFVCTSGSDQMAIQRYLSTRDIRSARRALVSLLVADALVAVFLSAVGLALSAYFWANPHLVPDGQTILSDSDKLFGRFMAVGFPSGLCGLAISGLLIAAMSSLSSGINSACSVVTVDFIGRFRKGKPSELAQVRQAKYVSVGIGAVVVTLACFVGLVQGNLIELCYKVVNLLVAPLFGLFFMAMFVRWATGLGTLVGAAAGLAVVIVISFWQEFTGTKPPISFVVAMPASLAVQVVVGMLASLIPLDRHRPLPAPQEACVDRGDS